MVVLWIVWLVSNRGKAEEADINGYDPTVLVVAIYDRLQLGRKKNVCSIKGDKSPCIGPRSNLCQDNFTE